MLHAACVVSQGMSGSVLMGEVRNAPEEACGVDPGLDEYRFRTGPVLEYHSNIAYATRAASPEDAAA